MTIALQLGHFSLMLSSMGRGEPSTCRQGTGHEGSILHPVSAIKSRFLGNTRRKAILNSLGQPGESFGLIEHTAFLTLSWERCAVAELCTLAPS